MSKSRFQKATRKKIRLRMALDGPSGAGKTYTALRLAYSLGQKVAVIDSESGSASKYVGDGPDGVQWEFDVLELDSYSPSEYTAAIQEAGRLGYDVLVIDSLSHAWEGKDGALEMIDKSQSKNRFTAWKDVTPMHRAMIEAILKSPCHVIATMRSKTEYLIEEDDKGRKVPVKVGTAPIQRQGMEYEFDIYGSMNWSHIMQVTKSRCPAVDGMSVSKPGPSFMEPVRLWLESGSAAAPAAEINGRITDEQLSTIVGHANKLGWPMDRVKGYLPKRYGVTELHHLDGEAAGKFAKWLAGQVRIQDSAKANSRRIQEGAAEADEAPEAEAEQPVEQPAEEPTNGEHEPADISEMVELADDSQIEQIATFVERLVELGMPREIYKDKILAKRNVQSARELTLAQADELIEALRAQIAADEEAKGITHEPVGAAEAKN